MFSNLTQSVGVPLNGVIINLGSFAVVERASFSSSSRLCVACNSAFSPATYVVRALLDANATQLNDASLLVLFGFKSFSFHFFVYLLVCYLKTSQASLCPTEMWNTSPSRPFSNVLPINQIHGYLFLIPPLAKQDLITWPRFSPLVCWQYPSPCKLSA